MNFRRSPCACNRGFGRGLARYTDSHHLPQAVGVKTAVIACPSAVDPVFPLAYTAVPYITIMF